MSRIRLLSSPRSFLFSAGSTRPASGIRLGFKPVSGYSSGSDCLGETNFFMDISDISERRVMITFHNRASVPCAVSDIYFMDGETFSISVQSVRDTNAAGSPVCAIDITTGIRQSAPDRYHDSNSYQVSTRCPEDVAEMQDGIKPNESLGIVFDLQAGVTLADIVSALSKGKLNISLKLLGASQRPAGILVNDSRLDLSPR